MDIVNQGLGRHMDGTDCTKRAGDGSGDTSGHLIVFIIDSFLTHALSTIGLARKLHQRGFKIEYWGHSYCADAIRARGFVFRELKAIWPFYENLLPRGLWYALVHAMSLRDSLIASRRRRRALAGALDRFERSLDRHCRAGIPALAIVHPFVLHYFPYIRARGVPCVVLQDKPLATADRSVAPPNSGYVPRDSLSGRVSMWCRWRFYSIGTVCTRAARYLLDRCGGYTVDAHLRVIETRTGVSALTNRVERGPPYDLHFSDVSEWVLDGPEFDLPRSRRLPTNIRYVGQCVDQTRCQDSIDIIRKPDTRYLVYIAMGTAMATWNDDLSLLRRIIGALVDVVGIQLVVSTGNARAREALAASFPNIDIRAFVPQLAVLMLADLAITHSGPNTVRECIATETPMLAFPRQYDQPAYSARIILRGLGLRGSRRWDNCESIRRKALRILTDDLFRERVRVINLALRAREESRIDAAVAEVLSRKLRAAAHRGE